MMSPAIIIAEKDQHRYPALNCSEQAFPIPEFSQGAVGPCVTMSVNVDAIFPFPSGARLSIYLSVYLFIWPRACGRSTSQAAPQ